MKRAFRSFPVAMFLILTMGVLPVFAWSGTLAWTYNAAFPITSSIAVADGLIIAGDSVGNLHAVYAASGQSAWLYRGTNTVVGLPTVSGKMVIFAQADGTVTALNRNDGTAIWKYAPGSEGYAADTVVDGTTAGDGRVFFVKGDGKMYALSAADGKELWTYDSGLELRNAPFFSDGIVYLGEQRGIFSAVNPKTGKRDWGGGAGGAINTPTTRDGNVYFSSWDGSVQSVRIRGVVPKWNANAKDPVTTAPFVGDGRVLVGTANGRVVSLSAADGTIQWSFDTGGGTVSAIPVLAEGYVFVGGGQGKLFVLSAADGVSRFTFDTGGGINGTPAFSGGVLFLGSADGNLYAIR